MTLLEHYNQEKSWARKVMLMEVYHTAQTCVDKKWTITMTAKHFDCSIGLVSENLKLARAIRNNERVMLYPTRTVALRKI